MPEGLRVALSEGLSAEPEGYLWESAARWLGRGQFSGMCRSRGGVLFLHHAPSRHRFITRRDATAARLSLQLSHLRLGCLDAEFASASAAWASACSSLATATATDHSGCRTRVNTSAGGSADVPHTREKFAGTHRQPPRAATRMRAPSTSESSSKATSSSSDLPASGGP